MSTIKSSDEHLTLNADGTSKDIKLQSNASEKVIIKSDGKVGIGTSSPARLFAVSTGGTKTDANVKYVQNLAQSNESSNQASLGLYFKGASSAADRFFQLQPAEHGVANDGWIEVNPDGGKFRARNGIYFGTDTATANALDDYEEGTWTPTLSGTSGGPSGVNFTYRLGWYTKIGRVVIADCRIAMSSWSSGPSGSALISGLPFNAPASSNYFASPTIGYTHNFDSDNAPKGGFVEEGSSVIRLIRANDTSARQVFSQNVSASALNGNETIFISVAYIVSA